VAAVQLSDWEQVKRGREKPEPGCKRHGVQIERIAVGQRLDFDPARGDPFMRFSFAGSTEDMAEAARRLKAWHNKARR
jgi:aspartate/methionine/tyrosine aminotransferase